MLNLNCRQSDVEFEFLPVASSDSIVASLGCGKVVALQAFKASADKFVDDLGAELTSLSAAYDLPASSIGRVVFISLASNDHHFYEVYEADYSVVFLGDWDATMAPPSLVESLITMVMLEGLYALVPDATDLSHYATRGCIGDFNATLKDTRYKVLQGFICNDCRAALEATAGVEIAARWIKLLGKDWVGRSDDPSSPAGIVRKLGYDLFITKGYAPTTKDRLFRLLSDDGPKELIKIIGGLILAGLLLWLGLKK